MGHPALGTSNSYGLIGDCLNNCWGFGGFAGEEVGEEDGGAYGSKYGVGGGEASWAPELAASSVERGHVDDRYIA